MTQNFVLKLETVSHKYINRKLTSTIVFIWNVLHIRESSTAGTQNIHKNLYLQSHLNLLSLINIPFTSVSWHRRCLTYLRRFSFSIDKAFLLSWAATNIWSRSISIFWWSLRPVSRICNRCFRSTTSDSHFSYSSRAIFSLSWYTII